MTVDDADLARCALPERPNADDDADDDAVPRLDVSSGATLHGSPRSSRRCVRALDRAKRKIRERRTPTDARARRAVSESGSLGRITNWGEMSEREREVARERIAKRNEAASACGAAGEADDGR